MGYHYAYTNVSRFLAKLRLPVGERPSIYRERISTQRPPTPRQMARERQGAELDAWIAQVAASELADLQRFAAGLLLDKAAVQAGLTREWSNGQTEGQVNRLKTVKRQMYGRAGFDLLRQRVLYRA